MYTKWKLIISVVFLLHCKNVQKVMQVQEIQEIWVYEYFNTAGYTTASLWSKFKELEKDKNVIKFKLEPTIVQSLRDKLQYARTRKVFQEKTGQKIIFSQFVMDDGSVRNIIITPNGMIDFYVEKKAYFFTDKFKQGWLDEYYNKILLLKQIQQ